MVDRFVPMRGHYIERLFDGFRHAELADPPPQRDGQNQQGNQPR